MCTKCVWNDSYLAIVVVVVVELLFAGNVVRQLSNNFALAPSRSCALLRSEFACPHPTSYTCCSQSSSLKWTWAAYTTSRNSSTDLIPHFFAASVKSYWYSLIFAALTLILWIFPKLGSNILGSSGRNDPTFWRFYGISASMAPLQQKWPRAPPASYYSTSREQSSIIASNWALAPNSRPRAAGRL